MTYGSMKIYNIYSWVPVYCLTALEVQDLAILSASVAWIRRVELQIFYQLEQFIYTSMYFNCVFNHLLSLEFQDLGVNPKCEI